MEICRSLPNDVCAVDECVDDQRVLPELQPGLPGRACIQRLIALQRPIVILSTKGALPFHVLQFSLRLFGELFSSLARGHNVCRTRHQLEFCQVEPVTIHQIDTLRGADPLSFRGRLRYRWRLGTFEARGAALILDALLCSLIPFHHHLCLPCGLEKVGRNVILPLRSQGAAEPPKGGLGILSEHLSQGKLGAPRALFADRTPKFGLVSFACRNGAEAHRTGKKPPSVKKDTGGTTRRELTDLLLTAMICERWGGIEMIGAIAQLLILLLIAFTFSLS